MSKVLIIGGGASGMAAAVAAAKNGHTVTIVEKNEKLGKKVYISGKGRCNLTNDTDNAGIMANTVTNPRFLYSALAAFSSRDIMDFLEENGCMIKTERGRRVFPASDHSSDVIRTFEKVLRELGVELKFRTEVKSLLVRDGVCTGVETDKGRLAADAVIVATGGRSYEATGSTGDGYRFARDTGHQVAPAFPALVPLRTKEDYGRELAGLSLKNVAITIPDLEKPKKPLYKDFGEMLFTHTGVSGPVILSASSYVTKKLRELGELKLLLDLKPALSAEQLQERLLRDFSEELNKSLKNGLDALLPKSLIPFVILQSGVSGDKKINEITREERKALVTALKEFALTLNGTAGFNEAIVTQGGVSVKNIDSSTMESKLIRNLYFAGEVIDIDALTGGYNLQLAWSTGTLAGMNV